MLGEREILQKLRRAPTAGASSCSRPALQDKTASAKIDVINGWRGFAVIAVLIVHSFARMGTFHHHLIHILESGWVGVNAFFVASGFVLYLPYAQGRRAMTSFGDAAAFYRHRAYRLVPLCFVGSFVAMILIKPPPVTSTHFWILLANLPLATFSWIDGYNLLPGNGALWSISVEIALSAAFPLLILMVRRFGFPLALAVAIPAWLGFRLLLATAGNGPIAALQSELGLGRFLMFYNDTMGISTVEFLIGMAVAALYIEKPNGPSWPPVVFGALLVIVFCALYWLLGTMDDIHVPRRPFDALLPVLLDGGLALLLIGALRAAQGGIIWWTLSNWPIQVMGLMCYSLYVWHPPLFVLADPLGPYPSVFATVIIISVIVAAFSYRYLEFPNRPVSDLFLLSKSHS
jgi:peptidoglycan/LPS O-acetylase OafA/YrhL